MMRIHLVLIPSLLLCLSQQAQAALVPTGTHVCTKYITTYSAIKESYHHTNWGPLHITHKTHTRYRTKSVSNKKPQYYCCPGWTQARSTDTGCPLAVCHGKTNNNGACNQRGHCVGPDKCQCNREYTGSNCEKCLDQGGDPEHSIYWPVTSHPDCRLTCSWKNQWCWPGDCPNNRLRTSCKCRAGFRKIVEGIPSTKCDLTAKPELLTCNIQMKDDHNRLRRSTPGKNTGCQYESDTYVNLEPISVLYHLVSRFKSPDLTKTPNFISKQGFGIVQGNTAIIKQSLSGHATTIKTDPLRGGSRCSNTLGDLSPSPDLTCSKTFPIGTGMKDGERLCLKFTVTAGGYFNYWDYYKHPKGTQKFSHQSTYKQLCFRYDFSKPVHCSKLSGKSRCNTQPLELSKRVTRSRTIKVKTTGWTDPVPNGGKADAASGLDYTTLQVMSMNVLGPNLVLGKPAQNKLTYSGSFTRNNDITLPDKSGLYAVLLEVVDKAKNIQTVRRLVLYDKSSVIKADPHKPLRFTTARSSTNYVWQTDHGPVCAEWKDRFYNDHFVHNNPLLPVKHQSDVGSEYDQTSGDLPVTGTNNVYGITETAYNFSVDEGRASSWKSVPGFTNQSICLTPTLLDGQTFTLNLKMKDIVNNVHLASVSVHIDSTVPDISQMWLVKDGHKQIYVHNSLDLSTVVLQFQVTDPHSGVKTVDWYFGTKDSSQDLGHGNIPVTKLKGTSCPPSSPCYCPSVGACQYSNHTVSLNHLVQNNTNHGQHNQEFYFTVVATNGANLRNIDHLDILVDTSPPESGIVKEGSVDGPDVDYTSEDNVLVNWANFIDHESGIDHYLVSLAPTCLSLAEITNSSQTKYVASAVTEVKFPLKSGGKYYSSVVAYNKALSPSKVACSDGIIKDDSPPVMYNMTLRSAKARENVVCYNGTAWLVSGNLTMFRLKASPDCIKRCLKSPVSYLSSILPKETSVLNDTDLTDNLCRELPYLDESSIIFLPSDKIYISWNSSEAESQIRDFWVGLGSDLSTKTDPDLLAFTSAKGHSFFKLNHAGIAGHTIFFIFVKAVNKAGLTSYINIGPVMIDYTPPVVKEKLKPEIDGDYVFVKWNNHTIEDPEQQENSYVVLYRIVHSGKHVTPVLQTPETVSKSCQIRGYAGCVRYPLQRLKQMDSELNDPFTFELYVYNSAGHFSTVSTMEIRVASAFPPGHGIVHDSDPERVDDHQDIDYHTSPNKACVQWTGFYHHVGVKMEVAFGTAPNRSDIVAYKTVTSNNQSCITSSALKSWTKYYATIKATCSGGTSLASSNGFMIINQPKDNDFVLKIFDGPGCSNLQSQQTTSLRKVSSNSFVYGLYTTTDRLHIGQRYTMQLLDNFQAASSDNVLVAYAKGIKGIFEFVPLVYYPTFRMAMSKPNSHLSTPKISMCSEDEDYIVSRGSVSFHWELLGPWKKLTTHFEIDLEQETQCPKGGTCFITVDSRQVKSSQFYLDFTNVNLHYGHVYRGNVRPCFDKSCLDWVSSDGMKVITDKVSLKITNEWSNLTASACDYLTLHLDYINCEEKAVDQQNIIFQWSVIDKHGGHWKEWKTEQGISTGKVDVCLNSTLVSNNDLQLCVRATCPSGLTSTVCDFISRQRNMNPDGGLIETSLNSLKYIREDIITGHGDIHSFDIDYAESGIEVAGVLISLQDRQSTWYIMTKQEIPSNDCDSDNECIATVEATGAIGTFSRIPITQNGRYFICVHSPDVHSDGDSVFAEISRCGDGFIVDNDPPEKGEVTVLNQKDGFLTAQELLIITWTGFSDKGGHTSESHGSGIANFSYAVGKTAEGQDSLPFVDAGFVHNARVTSIKLKNGETYFVTVKATDHLGHMTTAVSDPVTVDVTPPVQGNIFIGSSLDSHMTVSSESLLVHWDGFHDQESGISSFQISVASKETSEIIPYKECTGSFGKLSTQGRLTDGYKYMVKLQATNRAGLSSVAVSSPFTYDSSPPTVGVVRDGRQQTEDDYQMFSDNVTCHWAEFHDPHSGLAYFRVGLGTQPHTDDIETMTHVGLRSEHTWTDNLPVGAKLYCSVEACNQAGLCSRSVSDGIILDNSPPVPGLVFVGSDGHHHKYHGHVSTLRVSWIGFEDPQTGINHFDWCVGSAPGQCDVVNRTNNILSDSVIKTGLNLPVRKPLYTTVKATNPAGLVSSSTSESFIVDKSKPTVAMKPTFVSPYLSKEHPVTVQWENSILKLAWEFQDTESPIERHFISLSTHHDSTAAVESIHQGAENTATIVFPRNSLMRTGDTYTAIVTACNAAGLCSSSSSSDILIDSTPPEMGGIKLPLTWETLTKGGKTTTRLHLRWYGFSDVESGISNYSISVSRVYDGSELSGRPLFFQHNPKAEDQTTNIDLTDHVKLGENIITTITAKNHAGLPSKEAKVTLSLVASDTTHSKGTLDIQRFSCPIVYCTGECSCAVIGQKCIEKGKKENCTDITSSMNNSLKDAVKILPGLMSDVSESNSASCLSGFWSVDDNTLNKIKRFEWSMGQKGQDIGYPIFDAMKEPVWYSVGKRKQVTHCLPNGTSLMHDTEYVIYLRVWFSFSQFAVFQSHPILVDHTPPSIRRAKSLLDSEKDCQDDKDYFRQGDLITICWKDLFLETQGLIKDYEIWLGTTPEGSDVQKAVSLGNQTSFQLSQSSLKTGTRYYATIRATNAAGLHSTLVSDGFIIDDEPPVTGVVFNSDRHKNKRFQASTNTLSASWHGFEDYHSYVERFEVAVVERDKTPDDSMFKYHGLENELVIDRLTLGNGKSYRVAVRAVDAAGLTSNIAFSPTLTIDSTPPHAFVCTAYQAQNVLKFMSFLKDKLGLSTRVVETSFIMTKGALYKVTAVGQRTLYNSHVIFKVGKLSVAGRFEKNQDRTEASHTFVYDEDGKTDIIISITGPNVSDVSSVYISKCKTMSETHKENAIRVHQIRPSVVAVCTNIMDPESDVRSVWMGAGTTKGGYQIRALSPTAVSNHEMILVQEPHGSPVYITVMAENQAGLRTIFTSTPIIIDHTPPEVVLSTVTISYDKTSTNKVTLDVSWQAKDDESDIGVCYCAEGKHAYSFTDWASHEAHEKGHCVLKDIPALHHSYLYAGVRCINTVGLETTVSSDPLQILHYAPTLQPNSLKTLVDNVISTDHLTANIQAYNDHVEFFWPGIGSQSANYECRLVNGSVPLSNWISAGNRTYMRLDGLSLLDGHSYEVQVRVRDGRHQYSQALKTSVRVDRRSPVKTGHRPTIQLQNGSISVDWKQTFDLNNMEAVYVVSIGTRHGYADITKQLSTKETHMTTHIDRIIPGVFLTIMAKTETGKFGLFSEFMIV